MSIKTLLSQSLSSRAMSFDDVIEFKPDPFMCVSIPFEQGDVFRPIGDLYVNFKIYVSIPFEQGDVFRLKRISYAIDYELSQSLSSRAMSFDD